MEDALGEVFDGGSDVLGEGCVSGLDAESFGGIVGEFDLEFVRHWRKC
jgi:hypothetical protein